VNDLSFKQPESLPARLLPPKRLRKLGMGLDLTAAEQACQLPVAHRGDLESRDRPRALGGLIDPGEMCIKVDLPEPDGPITAVKLDRLAPSIETLQRVDGRVVAAVAAGHLGR
jgi:hypothetical protein